MIVQDDMGTEDKKDSLYSSGFEETAERHYMVMVIDCGGLGLPTCQSEK